MGRLDAGVDPDDAVAMLVLAMQGLMTLARSGTSAERLQAQARASVGLLADRA